LTSGKSGSAQSALPARSIPMMDVIMIASGLGLFALTIAYSYACERL
jgi:hypothetical protein